MTAPALAEPLTVVEPDRQHLACQRCGMLPARRYMNAWLCSACAPVVPVPDPERTAEALTARRLRLLRAMRAGA